MRLLTIGTMYPPHHLGGYETVWQAAVEDLRAAGHEVRVLATDVRVDAVAAVDPPHVRRALGWYWEDHAFPPRTIPEVVALERRNAAALDAELARGVDAVQVWALGGLSLGLLERLGRAGVPVGAVVHDAWPVYGPKVDGWLRQPRGVRAIGRLFGLGTRPRFDVPRAWSFNSAWLRDQVLVHVPPIPAGRTQVDHPGVDVARFAGVPERREWGWRLACVGRIDARKGVAHAIEALGGLPPDATLVVAGAGDERHLAELRALASRLGVAERVRFTGQVDDVASVYADADAVLFPVTWDEPFGLVPLEAMSAGRPVVGTATGGAAEYLRDGANAVVVPRGDAGALAAGVRRLAASNDLRAALVTGGRATAQAHDERRWLDAMRSFAEGLAR